MIYEILLILREMTLNEKKTQLSNFDDNILLIYVYPSHSNWRVIK